MRSGDDAARPMLVGGEWIGSADRLPVVDPATGAVIATVPDADATQVRQAIDAASEAQPGWASRPASERASIVRAGAAAMRANAGLLADLITDELGKPLGEARGEVDYAASFLEWFAGEAERVYGRTLPVEQPDKRALVLRQPVGVTAAITPWNFPAAMITRKLGAALAAGCTMIVKPAPATPLTALEIGRLLAEAGVPPGVMSIVTSDRAAEVSRVLFADRRVRKVSFTGSTAVGKKLIEASAGNVTRLSLELGGHAPFIVFDDADLDIAVQGVIASKFRNGGQACICANRIFVQRGVHDAFTERLAAGISALRVGSGRTAGVNVGPLLDQAAVEKSQRHVDDAVRHGARLVVRGELLDDVDPSVGTFFAPTLVDGISPAMEIWGEETFGPVAGVCAFDSEEEVVRAANDTEYGLAAYFYTRDYARIFRVAEALQAGIIGANDSLPSAARAPFGGVKQSGLGREGGVEGIDEYLDVKYLSIGGVR